MGEEAKQKDPEQLEDTLQSFPFHSEEPLGPSLRDHRLLLNAQL